MGLTEAIEGLRRLNAMCPACRKAAVDAGKRIEKNCHDGKHAKAKPALSSNPPS